MIDDAVAACRRLLLNWTDLVGRSAVAVVALSAALTVAAAAYFAESVAIDTDTTDMLSADLPFRQDDRAIDAAFPQFNNTIVVVIDGENPDRIDDSASALAERLRDRSDLFSDVFDPAGHPFFRRNGLLFLGLDELYALGDRLAEAQPFLGALWTDPSLRGLAEMLDLAAAETVKADGASVEVTRVFDVIAKVAESQARGGNRTLSWRRLMSDSEESNERRILVVRPALDFSSLEPASAAMAAIRAMAADVGADAGHGIRVRLTGSAALEHEELASVKEGMGYAAILSLCLVIVLLLICFRSLRLAAATLITLVFGLIWTAAFAIGALGNLNLISVAFAVLFIGLSVDFGIHYGLRYREALDAGRAHAEALREAALGVGGGLTLAAVAAAIGFYSFLPTAYVGLAELGLIAGTGMFFALFANVTVLPALLSLMRIRPRPSPHGVSSAPVSRVRRSARPVLAVSIVLGVGAVAVAPGVRFDFDPLNLKDPETESVSTMLELPSGEPRSGYAVSVLAKDLDEARRIAQRAKDLESVESTLTLAEFVPKEQDEKLEAIESLALILEPSLMSPQEKAPAPGENRAALEALDGTLARVERDGDGETARAAGRLRRALKGVKGDAGNTALAELERRLLVGLPGRLSALRDSLAAEPIGLDDVPVFLRERWVTADGRARVRIFASRPTHRDREALGRFVEEVRAVAPHATGSPVIILEAGRTVVRAFVEAAAIAVVAISVLLAVLLRGVREIALIFLPLALAAALTVAASVLMGAPFNFANVIVLPLLFGLGVAGGLHLVMRERSEGDSGAALATSTPRAVVFSALTTIGSFGSIALSSHPGTASMGVLLTVAISLTLLCTLVVLPAMMAVWRTAPKEL